VEPSPLPPPPQVGRCPVCGEVRPLFDWPFARGTPSQVEVACRSCIEIARRGRA
jgi:hypothetical protein